MRNRVYYTVTMIAIILAAIALFVPLFIYRAIGPFDFWWWMSLNLALLIGVALKIDPSFRRSIATDLHAGIPKKIAFGILAAAVLYFIFFAGNVVSRKLFAFAGQNIAAVYDFKAGAAPIRIWLLMTLIIGPGEEVFWRGYLQRALALRFGPANGCFLAAMLYAGVHLASGNVMLVVAALVCGFAWGWLYLRFGSITLNAVSHTVWDVSVFLLFPFS
jgi:uncharacterized protein